VAAASVPTTLGLWSWRDGSGPAADRQPVRAGWHVVTKKWLSRAAGNRWFPPASAVEEDRFQGPGEPYPRHWREFPGRWPDASDAADVLDVPVGDPDTRRTLRDALQDLPARWREVVVRRDVEGHDPDRVARDLGLSRVQQRAMLNMARASLRERLATLLSRADGR
jgi:DNA-directed RNA polymerase specialized sigma24 family protein